MNIIKRYWVGFKRHWLSDLGLGLYLSVVMYGIDVLRYGVKPLHPVLHSGTPALTFYIMTFVIGAFFVGPWVRYCEQGPIGNYSRRLASDIRRRRMSR